MLLFAERNVNLAKRSDNEAQEATIKKGDSPCDCKRFHHKRLLAFTHYPYAFKYENSETRLIGFHRTIVLHNDN